MRLAILFISFCLFFGCSSTNVPSKKGQLIEVFNQSKASTGTLQERDFYTQDVWQSLMKARSLSVKDSFTNVISMYPNDIVDQRRSIESIDDNGGCLLVSGINRDGQPVEYYIGFIKRQKRWLVGSVTVHYFLDGEKPFLDQAICDAKERQLLWLESTKQFIR